MLEVQDPGFGNPITLSFGVLPNLLWGFQALMIEGRMIKGVQVEVLPRQSARLNKIRGGICT